MPIYTGAQDALDVQQPNPPAVLRDTLALIELAADQHGVTYDLAPIRNADAALSAAHQLTIELTERTQSTAARLADAGTAYAAGKVTAGQVVDIASVAATLNRDGIIDVRRHIDNAARATEATGLTHLRKVTEAQWLAPLRPLVTALLAEADDHADRLGINERRPTKAGVRVNADPWAPTRDELSHSLPLRHAWENLEDVLTRLDAVHGIADALRRNGLIPAVEGRVWCEDFRWLHRDKLLGTPARFREFYLANRAHGAPGIYTSAELTEADQAAQAE